MRLLLRNVQCIDRQAYKISEEQTWVLNDIQKIAQRVNITTTKKDVEHFLKSNIFFLRKEEKVKKIIFIKKEKKNIMNV